MYKKFLALAALITLPLQANYLTLVSNEGKGFTITRDTGLLCGNLHRIIAQCEHARKGLPRLPNGEVAAPTKPLFELPLQALSSSQLKLVVTLLNILCQTYSDHGVFNEGVLLDTNVRMQLQKELCTTLARTLATHIHTGKLAVKSLETLRTGATLLMVPELKLIADFASGYLRDMSTAPQAMPRKKKINK